MPTESAALAWLASTPATYVPASGSPPPPPSSTAPPGKTVSRSTTAGAASVVRSTPVSTTQTLMSGRLGPAGAEERKVALASIACGVKGSSASAGGAAGAANATVVPVAVSRRRMVRLMFIGGGSGRGAGRTAAPAKAGAAGGSGGQGRTVTLVGLATPGRNGNPGSWRTRARKTCVPRWVSPYFALNVP